ncbi:MAG: hypothetical protein QXE05_10595 [Nitrososphaeria archaeon]
MKSNKTIKNNKSIRNNKFTKNNKKQKPKYDKKMWLTLLGLLTMKNDLDKLEEDVQFWLKRLKSSVVDLQKDVKTLRRGYVKKRDCYEKK